MEKIRLTAEKALATPMTCYDCIVDGFRFFIHWDPYRNWFEAPMFFDPEWSHKEYTYADTVDELVEKIAAKIADAKRLWTNGGRYPENYNTPEYWAEKNAIMKATWKNW